MGCIEKHIVDGRVVERDCYSGAPRAAITDGPSLLQKAKNLAVSAAGHVAAGMPQASDEEIARRFAICQQCEQFDGAACRKCGCGISRERRFFSKLSWAAEKCPIGKWGPVAGLPPGTIQNG